jgi:hypothetical protein
MITKVFDANAISANVYIGDVNLDLKKFLEKVAKDMDCIKVDSELQFSCVADDTDDKDGGEDATIAGYVRGNDIIHGLIHWRGNEFY